MKRAECDVSRPGEALGAEWLGVHARVHAPVDNQSRE